MTKHKKYLIDDCDLYNIRNRNEQRVIAAMIKKLEELGNPELPEKILCDVYAHALNKLPSRYVQSGSIVLRDPVKHEDIDAAVSESLQLVLKNPKL